MEQAPVSCLSGLYLTFEDNIFLFVSCRVVESKLVKLETSRTMIPLPTLSIEISEGYLVLFP